MEANELRIGNLVYDTKGNVNIIDLEAITYILKEPLNQVKPIPINEEWLLKLGFEENEGWDNMVYFNKNNIHIYKCNNSDKEWFEYECELLISSVHQLQNLYFALTNEELQNS